MITYSKAQAIWIKIHRLDKWPIGNKTPYYVIPKRGYNYYESGFEGSMWWPDDVFRLNHPYFSWEVSLVPDYHRVNIWINGKNWPFFVLEIVKKC